MLFDRPVPADLAWGVIGEWSPKTDYTKLAKGIYAKLGDHNLLRSVVFFKGDEEVGRWGTLRKSRRDIAKRCSGSRTAVDAATGCRIRLQFFGIMR
jgi:hypothetical protein